MPIEEKILEMVTTPNRWLTKEKMRCRIKEKERKERRLWFAEFLDIVVLLQQPSNPGSG